MKKINAKEKKRAQILFTALNAERQIEGPFVFTGTWCFNNPYDGIEASHNDVLIDYPLHNPVRMLEAHDYVNRLYEKLLPQLAIQLDNLHATNYGAQGWRIIIGPWLHRYLEVTYDRWLVISQVKNHLLDDEYNYFYCDSTSKFSPYDYIEYGEAMKTDEHNHYVMSKILKHISPAIPIRTSKIKIHEGSRNQAEVSSLTQSNTKKIIKRVLQITIFQRIINFFVTKQYVICFDFYGRSLTENMWRSFWLKDLSFFSVKKSLEKNHKCKANNRAEIQSAISGFANLNTDFEQYIRIDLADALPIVYLEGFADLHKQVNSAAFPKKANLILTSTGQWSCEIFKCWVAGQSQLGATLVISQHGGAYGTTMFSFFEEHEIQISSKYLTWGWGGVSNKFGIVSPPFCGPSNISNSKLRRPEALVILRWAGRYLSQLQSDTMFGSRAEEYIKHVIRVIEILNADKSYKIKVKLFPNDSERGKPIRQIIQDQVPDAVILEDDIDLNRLMREVGLVVHTYDGTTFLEALAQQTPSILVIDGKLTPIRQQAQPDYMLLKDCGVFFDDIDTFEKSFDPTEIINSSWWQQAHRQKKIQLFCAKFANKSYNLRDQICKKLQRVS